MVTESTAQSKHYRFGDDPAALASLVAEAGERNLPLAVTRWIDKPVAGGPLCVIHYQAYAERITGALLFLVHLDGTRIPIPRWQIDRAALIHVPWEEC